MACVILFILICTLTGFLLTFFLSARYPLLERLTYGVVTGLGLYTWITYLFSLFLGLRFAGLFLSIALLIIFCAITLLFRWKTLKEIIVGDSIELKNDFLQNKVSYAAQIAVFSFFSTIFFRLFYRTIIWKDDGMYIGLPNNYGDLTLHLAYITSFVYGGNIPPQDTSFAGEKLSYPILSDFLSAIFLKLGLDFRDIMFIPGFILTVALYGSLYYFARRLTQRRFAAIISAFLFFFTGGFGFYYFFQDLTQTSDFWSFLMNLPRDYTKITNLNYQWITPLTCLNVPQRAFLLGFPMTLMVFTLLYVGIEQKKWKEFLFAGAVAGALPFFHTHSFLAILMVTIPLGIIFWNWRHWFLFFMTAFLLSLPQVLYLTGGSETVGGGNFFRIGCGWVAGRENVFWFWLKNTGLFWFTVLAGFLILFLVKKDKTRAGYYSLPFLLLFFLPNVIVFAPWNWDNIKILIYWLLCTSPLAALSLVYLYECRRFTILSRVGFFLILFSLVAAGGIDVFKYAVFPVPGWKEYSTEELQLAESIAAETTTDAVFLNAPVHNHPIFLAGRKTLMGYPGHIWSHGYKGTKTREEDIKKMLKGEYNALSLIDKYGPDFASIGPHEKHFGANVIFFDYYFPCIINTRNYKIYDLREKKYEVSTVDENQGNTRKLSQDGKFGLRASYYGNMHWNGKPLNEELVQIIGFDTSAGDQKPMASPFSIFWRGYILINNPGTYTFKLTSDDGSLLYIDKTLVVNNGGLHPVKSETGRIHLTGGKHEITIKYFDGGGGAVFNLV